MITKKKFEALSIFVILITFTVSSLIQAQNRTIIKDRPSEKEKYVVELLKSETTLSDSENRKVASAIVRFSKEIQFKDSFKIANEKIDETVFLISFIKYFSNFQKLKRLTNSYGYMAVSESMVLDIEKEYNAKINRTIDIFEPNLNLKIGVRKLNGILSKKKSIGEAVSEYANLSGRKVLFSKMEEIYLNYIEKNQNFRK